MTAPLDKTAEAKRRLKARNWAVFAALAAFALLIYAIAVVRMGGA